MRGLETSRFAQKGNNRALEMSVPGPPRKLETWIIETTTRNNGKVDSLEIILIGGTCD